MTPEQQYLYEERGYEMQIELTKVEIEHPVIECRTPATEWKAWERAE